MSTANVLVDIAVLREVLSDRGAFIVRYDRTGRLVPDTKQADLAFRVPERVADLIGRSTLLYKRDGNQVWTCDLEPGRSAYLLLDRDNLAERPAVLIIARGAGGDVRLFDSLPIGILNLDSRFEAWQANGRAEAHLGAAPGELAGSGWQNFFARENLDGLVSHFRNPKTADRPYRQSMLLTRPGQAPRHFEVVAVAQWQSAKSPGNYCLSIVDMGSDDPLEETRTRAPDEDALSHLMNRRKFLAAVDALPERERRDVGFAYIDLDNFKAINDGLGHHVGDGLLRIVATRLRSATRSTDFLARAGGDEIIIACRDVGTEAELELFGRKLEGLLNGRVSVAGVDAELSTSIGLSHAGHLDSPHPEAPGKEPPAGFAEALLKNADAAMHQAKAEGKGQTRMYSEALNQRMALLEAKRWEFERVTDEDAVTCWFQPVAGIHGPVAVEALTRTTFELTAHRSIEEFIATAKRGAAPWAFLDRLTRLAINAYGGQLPHNTRLRKLALNLNIDVEQLLHDSFPDRLLLWCRDAGVEPGQVCLEIAETALASRAEDVVPVLGRLRERGFRLAMDDFGTGHTSIQHLLLYEFDQIKIDRFFIERALESEKYRGFLHALVAMGRSASIQMLAEGVESRDEEALCLNAGVELLQGFHLGRPAPIEELFPAQGSKDNKASPGA